MMPIIFLILWIKKELVLNVLSNFLKQRLVFFEGILFYFSYSMEEKMQLLLLDIFLYKAYQILMVILLVGSLISYMNLGFQSFLYLLFIGLLLIFIYINSEIRENKVRLAMDLNRFLFIYELFLIQGENQFNALNKALEGNEIIPPAESVEDHLDSFQRLFKFTKWLIVKRIVILIEKTRHFSQRDMSMDFAQISDELFRKTYHDRKLEAEKVENMMLFPMIGDLLIMIIYVVSPFLGSLIEGG